MDTVNFVVFVIGPIVLFGGVLIWAFGRKPTAKREELEKPVTHHSRQVS